MIQFLLAQIAKLKSKVSSDSTKIEGILSKLAKIGDTKTIAWTAESSSAVNTQLTEKATLDKGVYIAIGATPTAIGSPLLSPNISNQGTCVPNVISAGSSTPITVQINVTTDGSEFCFFTSTSGVLSFSNLDRGTFKIVKIA